WIEIDFPHMIELKNKKLSGEKPRCKLERVALDFSNHEAARRTYADIGAKTKKALVITEGVIPYLTNDQAGQLARDLRAIPSFQLWIQDYRQGDQAWRNQSKVRNHLKNAPFQFRETDPFTFFGKLGWAVQTDVNAIEEGERLGRPFPIPFPWSLLTWLMPKKRITEFRQSMGYVMFRADGR
ncbi:MAG: class I SAM-dependent methyltransferase, partial [Deltaproteobacteria bacterium]|nr:class I SAM-dependent methyltransferase [Deltaproteobacteria bacterium]